MELQITSVRVCFIIEVSGTRLQNKHSDGWYQQSLSGDYQLLAKFVQEFTLCHTYSSRYGSGIFLASSA